MQQAVKEWFDGNPGALVGAADGRRIFPPDLVKGVSETFDGKNQKMAAWFTAEIDGESKRVLKRVVSGSGKVSVTYRPSKEILDATDAILRENIELIKTIPRKYFDQLEEAMQKSIRAGGNDLQSLYKMALKHLKDFKGDIKKRAAFIARDQNHKATGMISRLRCVQNGITHGIWVHSGAMMQARASHVAAGEKALVFNLRKGALLKYRAKGGVIKLKRTWPGYEPNCKCYYKPIIREFMEEEEYFLLIRNAA
jgi:Uncharacterized protein, homolog of phage Mu protein gp30